MVLKIKTFSQQLKDSHPTDQPLIHAKNLCIKYESEKEKRKDFKSLVHDHLNFNKEARYETVWALKEVNFVGYPGEVLGIIGPNGAGKTTLCRAILGVMKPDMGSIHVNGKVSSMLSLGTGFDNEMSGRENIFLNGLMLGLSLAKLKFMLPSIEEFTGLGRFLNYPLKHYSSGMRARLGFSIVSALEPEIMVIDEVLGTGDLEFKERAIKKMLELVSNANMVVVVTHDIDFVEDNCTRVLWLNDGRVNAIGNPKEVTDSYRKEVADSVKTKKRIISFRKTTSERGNDVTIQVNDLGVNFKLGRTRFWALKDVSFTVQNREILGIIGPNGAGKTTLCRTLSGLYQPDKGYVKVKGNITALLSFRLGFNANLSGFDNIYLNGMMLGIPKKNIRKLENKIIEFSELEKVIHRPVKEYSSGMKTRLGFSIAATLQPDVLIVDEALSAGDMAFRTKATARMQEMLEDAKTVVLVTHSLSIVENVCTRAIWLQQGTLRFDGDPREAVALYKESVNQYRRMKMALPIKKDVRLKQAVEQFGNGNYEIAETLLEEVLRESPDDLVLLTEYAIMAENQKNITLAKKRWDSLIQAAAATGKPLPKEAQKYLDSDSWL